MLRRKRMTSLPAVDAPLTRTSPALGVSSRLTSFSVVVFPDPLRPSRTNVSPRCTCKFKPESNCCPLGRVEATSRNSMSGPLGKAGSILATQSLPTLSCQHKVCKLKSCSQSIPEFDIACEQRSNPALVTLALAASRELIDGVALSVYDFNGVL